MSIIDAEATIAFNKLYLLLSLFFWIIDTSSSYPNYIILGWEGGKYSISNHSILVYF